MKKNKKTVRVECIATEGERKMVVAVEFRQPVDEKHWKRAFSIISKKLYERIV